MTPEFVKELRSKLMMTQKELAETLGVTKTTVANWEQGIRTPRGHTLTLLKLLNDNPNLVGKLK